MKIHTCKQYSDEWWDIHRGKITASNFGKIITPLGNKCDKKKTETYLFGLAGATLLGTEEEGYTNKWMEHGTEFEPEAREVYQEVTGANVIEVGFVEANDPLIGCSPDGLIGNDGGLEIKCPALSTHTRTMFEFRVPLTYIPQIQGSLWVTKREWWDFMSYYPGMPPVIIRVFPDVQFISTLESLVREVLKKLKEINKVIKKRSKKKTP